MPPAASSTRKDQNAILKAQDKESKRARGALSCAECRRLKLKCDKIVPCSSCVRRGCESICPNGKLKTGQGTRFVLANTEKLHQKINHMSDRIRQLEDAITILQSTLSNEPHPLLSRELLMIKSTIELYSAVDQDDPGNQSSNAAARADGTESGPGAEDDTLLDAFGTLAIKEEGTLYYGTTAGSEILVKDQESQPTEDDTDDLYQPQPLHPSSSLVQSYPSFSDSLHPSQSTQSLVFNQLHAQHALGAPRMERTLTNTTTATVATSVSSIYSEDQASPHTSSTANATAAATTNTTTASITGTTLHHHHHHQHPVQPPPAPPPPPPSYVRSTSMPATISPSEAASVASLCASFPLSTNALQTVAIDVDYLLTHFLPDWDEGKRLADLYLEQSPWFFGAVTKRQLLEEMLPMWYYESRPDDGGWDVPESAGAPAAATAAAANDPSSSSGANPAIRMMAGQSSSPPHFSTSSSPAFGTQGQQHQASSSPQSQQPQLQPATPLPPLPIPTRLGQSPQRRTRTAHDLALLFMVFCFGALTDINLPAAPDNALAEQYYQLTKAALVLEPVLERTPSVATVQTLALVAIYEGCCGGGKGREESVERTWGVWGVAVKLAQSVGLHRDCARWKLSPAEVQKRRALFWEMFITDCWQSLATGRLATFSLPFVDCELPTDPDQTMAEDGSIQPSFPYWKARFGAECVSYVVQGTLTSRALKYSIILDLDRKVRDMELPLYAQKQLERASAGIAKMEVVRNAEEGSSGNVTGGAGAGAGAGGPTEGLGKTMSSFMPVNYRELTLLYIHRCFFAHAISTCPNDPIKSQYAPSFLAGYRSACTILNSVRQQFMLFPRQISRFWVLWTHAFSASVMLASVATHVSKQSRVSHAAFIELNYARDLFETAASYGGRAVTFLPILQKLQAKAQKSFEDSERGIPLPIPNDILKPSKKEEDKNELELFGGRTHTVSSKSKSPGNANQGGGSNGGSRAGSGSPMSQMYGKGQVPIQQQMEQLQQQQQLMLQHPSFEGVHPSLMNELQGFGGRIEAQIRQAQEYIPTGDVYRNDVSGMVGVEMQGYKEQQIHLRQQREEQERRMREEQMRYQQQLEQRRLEAQRQQLKEMEKRQQQEIEVEAQRQHYEQQRAMERERERERERVALRERQEYELRQRQQEYEQQRMMQQQTDRQGYPSSHYSPYDEYYSQNQSQPQIDQPVASSSRYPSNGRNNMSMNTDQEMPPPPPPPQPSRRQQSRSRSRTNLRQSYVEQEMYPPEAIQQYPPQQPPASQPLHIIPPEYMRQEVGTPSSTISSAISQHPPHEAFGQRYDTPEIMQGQQEYQYQQPQTPIHDQDRYQYWSEAPGGMMQPPPQQSYQQQQQQRLPQHLYPQQQQQPGQHFTPATILHDMVADDRSLQETWQNYMYNVGSPRQFFED